jgi:hypothetical protein
MKKHYRHENDCLNCGAELQGKFCHACGQENLQIKESFGHMMNHAISDYFHFDHQFFHTLKPLFLKPGLLTNQYMAGKRVQFLHPVKMYIFISLVYFVLVFQDHKKVENMEHKAITAEQIKDSVNKAVEKNIIENTDLTPEQKRLAINQVKLHTGFNVKKPAAAKIANKAADTTTKDDDDDDDDYTGSSIASSINSTSGDTTYAQYLVSQKKLPAAERDGWFERYYNEKSFALHDHKKDKKELIKEGIKHNFPKMMFLLLPLFALILKLSFWKNKKFYVEHLIYSFHLHCFVFLFLTFYMLLQLVIPADWKTFNDCVNLFVTVVIFWYIYRSLRVVYHRGRWRTISKMIGITFSYSFVFLLCFVLLAIITAVSVV